MRINTRDPDWYDHSPMDVTYVLINSGSTADWGINIPIRRTYVPLAIVCASHIFSSGAGAGGSGSVAATGRGSSVGFRTAGGSTGSGARGGGSFAGAERGAGWAGSGGGRRGGAKSASGGATKRAGGRPLFPNATFTSVTGRRSSLPSGASLNKPLLPVGAGNSPSTLPAATHENWGLSPDFDFSVST
jgi:hypothetical protein